MHHPASDVPVAQRAAISSLPGEPPWTGPPQPDPPMKYGKPEMSVAGQIFVAMVAVVTSLSAIVLVLWQLLMNGGD